MSYIGLDRNVSIKVDLRLKERFYKKCFAKNTILVLRILKP